VKKNKESTLVAGKAKRY